MYIQELIPHRGEMVLVDEVVKKEENFICVKTYIKKDNPFLENDMFPTFNVLEIMAQSLVVFRGLNDKDSSAKLGFLLGSRKFEIFEPYLKVGDAVLIKTEISDDFEGIGVYASVAFIGDRKVASASISVFNPKAGQLEAIMRANNG